MCSMKKPSRRNHVPDICKATQYLGLLPAHYLSVQDEHDGDSITELQIARDLKRSQDMTAPAPETKASAELPKGVADFETAIDAAGFGIFNVILLIVALPAAVGALFETSTISYILPSAECDLRLSLLDKGILNAITYAGMITSAIAWGYIADTKGRKKILVIGYLVDSLCVIGGSMSQTVIQLMIFKFFGGLVMCGPFAVLMAYVNELHSRQYRARVMMIIGMMFTVASLLLPLLALTILPSSLEFVLFDLSFHTWQVFLAISSVPSIISGLLLMFFPESPKFLMSIGRNAEALEIFAKIYAINKRQPRESYPIKELVDELADNDIPSDGDSAETAVVVTVAGLGAAIPHKATTTAAVAATTKRNATSWRNGFLQLRPLFRKPLLGLSLQFYLMNFCILLGQNTVRLWLPQLFASITEYEHLATNDGGATSVCAILEYSVNKTANAVIDSSARETCEVVITAASYTNNIVVALAGFCGYILAGSLVNLIGVKRILTSALLIAGICGSCLYFSSAAPITLALSSVFVTMGSISATSVISSSVNLFPTSLRTMIVSLAMMFGRMGSLLGNILFPMFMSLGCIPPFLMIGFVMFSASFLSAFLPNTNKSVLK